MTQSSLVQLAQAGDSLAIAALMNAALQAIGVTARVTLREQNLHILLESKQVLTQTAAMTFIHRGLARLGISQLASAFIYSRLTGQKAPQWIQRLDFEPQAIANPVVLAPDAELEAELEAEIDSALAAVESMGDRLPVSTERPGRLFDLLLLSLPLLVVFISVQIWSRYLTGSSSSQSAGITTSKTERSPLPAGRSQSDPFELAMARATEAVQQGKTAQSRQEWQQAADRWWRAIALLKTVPVTHPQHAIAQEKLQVYQRNLDTLAKDKLSTLPGGMELKKIITGSISPKSVVYSGRDQFFAQNMMYSHSITVYDREYNLVKTIADTVNLADLGHPQYAGEHRGAPVEAAFSQGGQVAWVSNYQMYGAGFKGSADDTCSPSNGNDPSFVYRINTNVLKIEQALPVGAVPKFVAASSDNRLVLVSNWCSWDVSVIDAQKNEEIRRIRLGPYPRGIAIDAASRKAYVAVMGSYDIAAIDLKTFSVHWLKDVGHSPRHLNLDPMGKYLYTTLNGEGSVAKIDLATETVVKKVATGASPRSMAIAANGEFLYVVNYNSDTVSKVRTQDMTVVQTVKVNPAPIGITYDPKTHQVWVACYSGSILVFQD